MALDYTTELAQVRASLMDSSSAIWADADLMGAIRLALEEINLQLSQAYTLKDLDSAAATTLLNSLEGVLTVGSSAYALGSRGVDRAEAYELANESESLKGLYELQRAAFEGMLKRALEAQTAAAEAARLAGLRGSSAPFGAWSDDFGEKGKSEV